MCSKALQWKTRNLSVLSNAIQPTSPFTACHTNESVQSIAPNMEIKTF